MKLWHLINAGVLLAVGFDRFIIIDDSVRVDISQWRKFLQAGACFLSTEIWWSNLSIYITKNVLVRLVRHFYFFNKKNKLKWIAEQFQKRNTRLLSKSLDNLKSLNMYVFWVNLNYIDPWYDERFARGINEQLVT